MSKRTLVDIIAIMLLATITWAGCDDGDGSTGTPDNMALAIHSLEVTPPVIARGGTAMVTVDATDTDGDSLSSSWSADGGFTVEEDTGAPGMATVTAPETPNAVGTVSPSLATANTAVG